MTVESTGRSNDTLPDLRDVDSRPDLNSKEDKAPSEEVKPSDAVEEVRGNMTDLVRNWVPGTGEWYAGYTE